jgi:hypothetical protein
MDRTALYCGRCLRFLAYSDGWTGDVIEWVAACDWCMDRLAKAEAERRRKVELWAMRECAAPDCSATFRPAHPEAELPYGSLPEAHASPAARGGRLAARRLEVVRGGKEASRWRSQSGAPAGENLAHIRPRSAPRFPPGRPGSSEPAAHAVRPRARKKSHTQKTRVAPATTAKAGKGASDCLKTR